MKNLLIGHRAKVLQYQGFSDIAQTVERVLGKDEVTSLNLVKSSRQKPRKHYVCGVYQ